jgi:hypothetical protein
MPKSHGKSVENWKRRPGRVPKPVEPKNPVSRWIAVERGPTWDAYVQSLIPQTAPVYDTRR